ncbi:aberrant root formation protein 4 isoform X1 [Juglans microcarpa x Juglans regia]|uniref:aberrant root formation protein 4 isoform X1 n=1 Tax=Juglans microcarpa x Juglans regia TaxID=2249226 RepID=UPI001B7ED8ED|nr:aberrant root formation protein 4 isoform X1 [Juglans microcarpa x Juglans regia]XP_041022692.1 aberrant root formation protein 4 isoform X1 [Juglans microcarpa x Juglans regia]
MSVASADNHRPSAALHVREILNSCSKLIIAGDPHQSENSISELVNFLEAISDAALLDPDNEDAKYNAFEVLSEVYAYLCSPSLDQEVIDSLSFELPKAVSKFASVSNGCLEIAESVINQLITMCSPRDMLSILCEALAKIVRTSAYFTPLLSGLSKVILSIRRHHYEQVKVAVPVIVNVLKVVTSETDDGDTEIEGLFDRVVGIASSIHTVCSKLEGRSNEKLCALLGLFVLEIMALVSISLNHNKVSCQHLVSLLSRLFPYCGLSYLGLITGNDVDKMTSIVIGGAEDEDDYMSCLSDVKLGASLSVIWGHISDEVAQAAEEDLATVKDELRSSQLRRWQTVGMLKHIYSFVSLPSDLKKHAIDFLLCITDGNVSQNVDDEYIDLALYMPSLFTALQAIKMVIIYAPNTVLRKLAFDAFKRVLADIPTSHRFEILKALITNTDSSSMIAILLDLVKGEMHAESCKRISTINDEVQQTENKECWRPLLWNASVLELVELVLRPPKGGPPPLPEQGDAVLSALNLYRFVLITESTGKTNYSEVLSQNNLHKAYHEWFLPLRTLVTGLMTENRNDSDQLAVDTVCQLNPIEMVLYRCIELVEENLKPST